MSSHQCWCGRGQYSTNLSDRQWLLIAPLIPPAKPGGRPRTTDMREVVNACLYIVKTGCQWSMLPSDFPPKSTVNGYFADWQRDGTLRRIHDTLRGYVRQSRSKKKQPTAAIIDSQTVKTVETTRVRGYDAGKKTKGRKRHIVVDTLGLVLGVVVHRANIQDWVGAKFVLERVRRSHRNLRVIWADGIYKAKGLPGWVRERLGCVLEIVKRTELHRFVVLPKRWIVERTFGWFNHYRRLSKDYERYPKTSEAFIHLAMIHVMVRRL